MAVRETSLKVWQQINDEGLLPPVRLKIYNIIYEHGPMTANQIGQHMRAPAHADRNIHARLVELREQENIKELGNVDCPVSGRNILLWDVTDNLPRPLKKEEIPPTRPELIRALCEQLEEIAPHVKPETERGHQWMERTQHLLKLCAQFRTKKSEIMN